LSGDVINTFMTKYAILALVKKQYYNGYMTYLKTHI